MNSNQNLENSEDFTVETPWDEPHSVDDFIKQLEAKEKDLHISSDLVIEIEESDLSDPELPDFLSFSTPAPKKSPSSINAPNRLSPNGKTFSELENKIEELKRQIVQTENKNAEIMENLSRRQRDFENYRNRTERERSEIFVNQVSNLATQMLPVLDNLDRALEFATDGVSEKTKEFEQFFQGIFLVNQQLNEVLAGMGVSPILSVGERFDPHCHEAVALEETSDFPPQTVSAEFLRGYRIGERIIRASMVKVATAVQTNAAESEKPELSESNHLKEE